MNTPPAWTLKSELHEDWHLLYPVFQVVLLVLLIFIVVLGIRVALRNIALTIRLIRENKK